MIRFRVKKLDVRGAVAKSGRVQREVVAAVTKAAQVDTDPYVPYLSGDLAASARLASDFEGGRLIYDERYARAQYYGLVNKTKTPHVLATMHWFEHSKAANFRRWLRVAQETANRVSRGR